MSAKTKIVVLHMKNLIIAGIVCGLGILILVLLFLMLRTSPGKPEGEAVDSMYVPGVYTSSVRIDKNAFDVQVSVDENHINSIELVNLDESMETMYPLLGPTLEELEEQVLSAQSVSDLTYSKNNQYTSMLLASAVKDALDKASPQ